MHEFNLVDRGSLLFERASGCELHRDPNSGKCKFLRLGRWRGTLEQEDLPVKYIRLSDHLDMLGVKLKASYAKTKKVNCDETREKLSSLVGGWRGGRHMHLSQRPLSAKTYALPLIWYRCHYLDLREGDFTKLTSTVKSWIFADCLEKPEELATYKRREEGGLGLHHVRSKSLAMLIRSFIETATGDKFVQCLYPQALF